MPSQADDEKFLHRGWDWLEGNASHDPRPDNYDALDAEWYRRLHLYEEAYRLVTMDVERRSPVVRAKRAGAETGASPARMDESRPSDAGVVRQASF